MTRDEWKEIFAEAAARSRATIRPAVPCAWDQSRRGSPPPWWTDGMPAELVRKVNGMTFRIERAHYGWVYGPMLREYYGRAL